MGSLDFRRSPQGLTMGSAAACWMASRSAPDGSTASRAAGARRAQQQQRLQQLHGCLAHARLVVGAAPARQLHQAPTSCKAQAHAVTCMRLHDVLSLRVLGLLKGNSKLVPT